MAACEESCDSGDEIKDSGAAPYGNFINYYSFNPPENRLSLIPASLLRDLGFCDGEKTLILDVGCNSGELSVALFKHLQQGCEGGVGQSGGAEVHLLGFDLDETLIERAKQNQHSNITFIPLDVTEDSTQLQDYLHLHGRSCFRLCVCLAVTMWVHLNHGDSGLLRLLSRLASLSQYLLLEAQPWKCYRSAARRLRKLGRSDFDHFKTLKIRGDVAERAKKHLERECGMELVHSFGRTAWDRKLQLFRKRPDTTELK